MSYLFILELVTFVFVIAECLAVGHERLQRQIYYLAFAWVVIWCTAKYAYGPDIASYIPFYNALVNPRIDLLNPDLDYFENGFIIFCSSLKYLGLSFWSMTAVISLLYFTAIGLLWKQIKAYKTTALFVLIALDYNLILMELRQCLAVTAFIFLILLFQKKKYFYALLLAPIMITLHKSAIMILLGAIIFYCLRKIPITKRDYILLSLLILILLLIPLQPLFTKIVPFLPLDSSSIESIEHHLLIGKPFQKVIILYVCTFICLAYYKRNESQNKTLHWFMWCCAAILVCLYPYWFLLNRLRSYFLPFLIIYIVNMLQGKDITDILPKQIYTVIVIGYILITMIEFPRNNKKEKYPVDTISLVFERTKHSEKALIDRQMKKAALYWEHNYDQMFEN